MCFSETWGHKNFFSHTAISRKCCLFLLLFVSCLIMGKETGEGRGKGGGGGDCCFVNSKRCHPNSVSVKCVTKV